MCISAQQRITKCTQILDRTDRTIQYDAKWLYISQGNQKPMQVDTSLDYRV